MVDCKVRQRLVLVLVLSGIDYCNVVFTSLPSVTLAPLRRVMNAAVRFAACLGPRDHNSDAQHERPTKPRYKLGGRVHRCLTAKGLYDIPHMRTLTGYKTFSVAGPTAWNNRPLSIGNISSAASLNAISKLIFFI